MLSCTHICILALLLIPTNASVPEDSASANTADTWRNSGGDAGGVDVEYYVPSAEERESLYRDLRSLRRLRNYKSAFPYYKGLGRK
ncbi:unnamed protein product [Caenorhabditis nigoni]|uniref:Uncharacterized protein n=1 Tax=Caenorhabditis nigoni TaxID=1611254 RepID=A0A2G5UCP4_9PELO|nr:hypothetical protein B9Z55_015970 [Caenorhabditis nigoni]